ncbi:AAA domain-containing protein [Sediminitomix flava]|uniref:Putative DNA helicase n=1 Tax=Sediminitomix flava TaxID=379075 RepID=A0A315Z0Z6_SEDFL|nr:AAA domain-containing protein [Sediminitomix flava]PWJ36181.1 putative DNA helicase [Sediminitomix flava]
MQEIKRLIQLLEIEKKEDEKYYREKVLQTPLGERKKKGFSWHPIKISAQEIGTGEQLHLTVERLSHLGEEHIFQTGKMISIFEEQNQVSHEENHLTGVVKSIKGDEMTIAFSVEELPEWVEDAAALGLDEVFDAVSYREMSFALDQLLKTDNSRLLELRDTLLGSRKPQTRKLRKSEFFISNERLNSSQNEALENIFHAQDVAIIHGPPGTGKTTTLVQAVKQMLRREKQILVSAPSNTATDLLSEKLAQEGLKVVRMGNPARVSEGLSHLSLDEQISDHKDYKLLKRFRRDAEISRQNARKYKRNFGQEQREERKRLYNEARALLKEADKVEEYIIEQILTTADVITSTLVGASSRYLRGKRFSTVCIDEAGQALEPASWIPILKADRVVFAGDHQQLPPTVKSFEASKQGLSETLFDKTIKRQSVDVMLKEQYRMHENIMGFSNQKFYKNELIANEKVKDWTLNPISEHIELSTAIEFIDTAGCGFDEVLNEETLSKMNPEEGNILLKHLLQSLAYLKQEGQNILNDNFHVGIISPYRAQVGYLQSQLDTIADFGEFSPYLEVNSVDGFQGQEKDVIYLSLVRSNDSNEIGFLKDYRRMNVAMTRAKKKLVIIGDSATISADNFYKDFLEYIDEINAYRSAWEFM